MRKDIEIPEVKDVYVAVVPEGDAQEKEWVIYLINDSGEPLESCLLVSRGEHADGRKTTTLRHAFKVVPAKGAQRVEMIIKDVLDFKNEYLLTYFKDGKLYDRTYTLESKTFKISDLKVVPVMGKKGLVLG